MLTKFHFGVFYFPIAIVWASIAIPCTWALRKCGLLLLPHSSFFDKDLTNAVAIVTGSNTGRS
jgi:hypothetical protein